MHFSALCRVVDPCKADWRADVEEVRKKLTARETGEVGWVHGAKANVPQLAPISKFNERVILIYFTNQAV